MTQPAIRFRYRGPCWCDAHHGKFHATVIGRPGGYSATLKLEGVVIATSEHRRLVPAQAWLRDQIRAALDESHTFELADWTPEEDLAGRFARRAARIAARRGLTIIDVHQTLTRLEQRDAIVRTYRCLQTAAPAEQGRA